MNYVKEFIQHLNNESCKRGDTVYLVGGYVRDKLINPKIKSRDIDFIYDGDIDGIMKKFNTSGYNFFRIKNDIDIYRCIYKGNIIDISKMNGKNIIEDLKNRDFTVNTVCLKLGENKIIDPFKGRLAIKNRIIRAVDKTSLDKDPIRILRAVRLYINYGMHFNLDTENMVIKYAGKLKECPGERISSELLLIIKCDKEGEAFEVLDRFSILKYLIPYVEELKTIGKCKYHIEDVFTHINLTYKIFKDIMKSRIKINNLDFCIFDNSIGQFSLREYTAFSCFLHDIGKYQAYKKKKDRVSFEGHEKKGVEICRILCKKFRLPKKASRFIETIVEAHMYPLMIFKKTDRDMKEYYYDFFNQYKDLSVYIIIVSFCDNYATRMLLDRENEKESYKKFIENMLYEYNIYLNIKNKKIIDGNCIENILEHKGPIIGNVINNIDKLRYMRKIITRKDAVDYVLKIKSANIK